MNIWQSKSVGDKAMESTIDIAGLKGLIRETMREVLQEERALLFKMLMPYVSDEEQSEFTIVFRRIYG